MNNQIVSGTATRVKGATSDKVTLHPYYPVMTSESRGQLTYLGETYDLSSKPRVFVIEGRIEERTNFLEIDEKITKKLGRQGYIGI